jgi:hypothetical protein
METMVYIFDLHAEHLEWLKALDFYEDDCKVLKNRLAEVIAKNSQSEVKAKVESYQNRLIIQENEIDELRHYIREAEKEIEANVKVNPIASDHRKVADNVQLRDRFETFKTLFAELKLEFNEFAGKNL